MEFEAKPERVRDFEDCRPCCQAVRLRIRPRSLLGEEWAGLGLGHDNGCTDFWEQTLLQILHRPNRAHIEAGGGRRAEVYRASAVERFSSVGQQ